MSLRHERGYQSVVSMVAMGVCPLTLIKKSGDFAEQSRPQMRRGNHNFILPAPRTKWGNVNPERDTTKNRSGEHP